MDRYRSAVLPSLLAITCSVLYAVRAAHAQQSGGSLFGMTLGTIAAALILALMGYGLRRRSFRAGVGSAARWLSFHVYFGLCVIVIATLHCAFQFGYNLHTLTYALLCLVVLSGCWGVYAYLRYPALLVRTRDGATRERLLERVNELDRRAIALAQQLSVELAQLVQDAVSRTRLGGSVWAQLSGRDPSMLMLAPPFHPGCARLARNPAQATLIEQLALQEAATQRTEQKAALQTLCGLTAEKAMLQRKLRQDVKLQALLQFWLYLHLPLSFALLAALAIHVFAVFFYR